MRGLGLRFRAMSSGASEPANGSAGELRRVLGPFDVTMLVMGSIIGAGVFNRPAEIARLMGSTGAVLVLWLLGGVFAFTGALVFAELGGMMPRAGGQYVFVREAFGRFAAFVFGWVFLTAVTASALAYVAGVFSDHVEALWVGFRPGAALGPATKRACSIGLIAFVTLVNARGVKLSALVQNACMLAKILGITAIVALGAAVALGWLQPSVAPLPSAPAAPWSWSGAGAALLSVIFAYGGWQNVAAAAGEIRRPERTLPLGILIGTLAVIALYVAFNAALIAILGVEGVAASTTPTADAAGALFPWGKSVVAALVALSAFAFVQGLSTLAPRIYYAMARDGLFFAAVGRLHPHWKTPVAAIVLQGLLAVAHVVLAGDELTQLVNVCILCDLVFFTSCGVALFRLRRTQPDVARPYRALGYPWLPALFVLTSAATLVQGVRNAERFAAMEGAVLFGVGCVLYLVWRRRAPLTSDAPPR